MFIITLNIIKQLRINIIFLHEQLIQYIRLVEYYGWNFEATISFVIFK